MAKNKSKGLISRSEPNSVGEEIPYLPIELVTEILLRLPGKLLLRYRRVCKVWCKIIDSPSFANTHLTASYAPKESELVFLKSPTHRRDTMKVYLLKADKFNCTINMSEYPIVEFVNPYYSICGYGIPDYFDYLSNYIGYGLFLFQSKSGKKNVFLYNPLRDEVLMLPPDPTEQSRNWFLHDGIVMNTVCGFDNATNEYKIVYTYNEESRGVDGSISSGMVTKIHTLGTRTWRKITAVPPVIPHSKAMPTHGYIHWIIPTTTRQEKLLSFDLKKEEYKLITLPELHGGWRVTLFNLKELLAIIRSNRDGLVIWILKDYENQEWVKQYTLNVELSVIGAWRDGVILYSDLHYSEIFYYDPKTDGLATMVSPSNSYGGTIISCATSLISLKNYGDLMPKKTSRQHGTCYFELEKANT